MGNEARLLAVVHGRVQGVSFRYFVLGNAQGLGLKGRVRNLPGGSSVEVVAEGERAGLEGLLGRLNQGPPAADVQAVDVSWAEASGEYADFRVL
ncbi:MAG: acylphosphatase [Chloroflexi bacterium]|nr:acylphosphatase [Chloroflexota bacterium]